MNRQYSEKVHDNITKKTEEWIAEFKETDYFNKLTKGQKKVADFIIEIFTDMSYTYHLRRPREWTQTSLGDVLSDQFPAKIVEGKPFFKKVEPVLTQYFLFLGATGNIKNSQSLLRAIDDATEMMIEFSDDESNWGFGKQIMSQADKLGFDMGDEDEIAKFINFYNSNLDSNK